MVDETADFVITAVQVLRYGLQTRSVSYGETKSFPRVVAESIASLDATHKRVG